MSTPTPEAQPELLEQIRHAIHHGNQPNCCRLCGQPARWIDQRRHYEPTDHVAKWHIYYLCDSCFHGPDDTGHCSYCRAYGAVHELTPSVYHCDACFQRELDSLDTGNEGEDATW